MVEKDDNNEPESQSEPLLGLALAGEWGFTLSIMTCLGGFAGYWLGNLVRNGPITVLLVLVGIALGFTLGMMRMIKVQEERVQKK